jgi:hypothetical protein
VPVQRLAAVLDNDVSMGLEDRDQLLRGGHGLAEEPTALVRIYPLRLVENQTVHRGSGSCKRQFHVRSSIQKNSQPRLIEENDEKKESCAKTPIQE